MKIKYDAEIQNAAIYTNLQRMINQIYKLLPVREEGLDWKKPLQSIIEELAGMHNLCLVQAYHEALFSLLCKLEGLFTLVQEEDFFLFRKVVFESITLVNTLKELCQ